MQQRTGPLLSNRRPFLGLGAACARGTYTALAVRAACFDHGFDGMGIRKAQEGRVAFFCSTSHHLHATGERACVRIQFQSASLRAMPAPWPTCALAVRRCRRICSSRSAGIPEFPALLDPGSGCGATATRAWRMGPGVITEPRARPRSNSAHVHKGKGAFPVLGSGSEA